MGIQRLSKENRLYWLGRYTERALFTIEFVGKAWDDSLDGRDVDYRDWCARLQIPGEYSGAGEFLESYLFDVDNPNSVPSSISRSFDNGVVLREVITSQALSYLQLAKNVMDAARELDAPALELQQVRDYLMAFRGCANESIDDEASRNTLKTGITIERMDMMLRLDLNLGKLAAEYERLTGRLRRTHLARDGKRMQLLGDLVSSPNVEQNKTVMLDCVEKLLLDV